MTTEENARWQAGENVTLRRIWDRARSLIKSAVVSLVLWRVVPFEVGEKLIHAMRLRVEP